jgi:lysyl-tRNA synthetase, class II
VPRAARWLVLLVGLGNIVLGVLPGTAWHVRHIGKLHHLVRLVEVAPGFLASVTRTADVIAGLGLVLLSQALRRRKRRAWQAVMLLLAGCVTIYLAHGHVPSAAVAGALLAAGWAFRREFYATGDPRTRWRGLAVLAMLLAADLIIGLSYISLRGLSANYTFADRVKSVLLGMVGLPGPVGFEHEGRGDFFMFLTGALGIFTAVMTAYLLLRPAEPPGRLGQADEARIRQLLDRHGESDSLGYFTLRHDKSIIWSATGKSCIGYRVLSGVMLASGDPIGDPEAWPGAISAFLDEAALHAWVPAVMGCSELGAEVWCRESGMTALELGDEAVVRVADFSLQGRCMRNVRQMTARVERAGYAAEVRRVADIPGPELAALIRQADSWRGCPTERGFSMALGRVGGPADGQCVVVTAKQGGRLRAILHFVPWGSDGLSLDLMRRDRSAQPGLNDFLIVEAIKNAPELGIKRISLNFAAFRAALERGERIGAGPVTRAFRRVLLFLSRWFQIESLYKFNAKFSPEWMPRLIVFPGPSDALRVGLAALEAEAFLIWPTVELRRLARMMRARLPGRTPGRAAGPVRR